MNAPRSRSPMPSYAKMSLSPSAIPKRSVAVPEVRNFHNTMAKKANLPPGSSRTAFFTVGTALATSAMNVGLGFMEDKGKEKLHEKYDKKPAEDSQISAKKESASGDKADWEELNVHLHHVHRKFSDEGKRSALSESENVYLNVIEGGEKRVFLARIEYLRELDPDENGEDALLLGEVNHEHHGAEVKDMK